MSLLYVGSVCVSVCVCVCHTNHNGRYRLLPVSNFSHANGLLLVLKTMQWTKSNQVIHNNTNLCKDNMHISIRHSKNMFSANYPSLAAT